LRPVITTGAEIMDQIFQAKHDGMGTQVTYDLQLWRLLEGRRIEPGASENVGAGTACAEDLFAYQASPQDGG
jgi:hypothetical protein